MYLYPAEQHPPKPSELTENALGFSVVDDETFTADVHAANSRSSAFDSPKHWRHILSLSFVS
jgi:hypothetical protein